MPKITKTRLLAVFGVALAIVICCYTSGRRTQLTEQNFRRIRLGMTRTEVESIFGPPGDYSSGPTIPRGDVSGDGRGGPLPWAYSPPGYELTAWSFLEHGATEGQSNWQDDSGALKVRFDEEAIAYRTEFASVRRVNQTLLDNLLWRFKRQWLPQSRD